MYSEELYQTLMTRCTAQAHTEFRSVSVTAPEINLKQGSLGNKYIFNPSRKKCYLHVLYLLKN